MKEKMSNEKTGPVIAVTVILSLFTAVCCAFLMVGKFQPEVASDVKDALTFFYQEPETVTNKEEKPVSFVRLMCAGDNLVYNAVLSQSASSGGASGGYDFSGVYAGVKKLVSSADIAVVSHSGVLSDTIPPAAYPRFSSPTAVGDALCNAGFDVINQATANIYGFDEAGVSDTINYWKTKENAVMTGLYETPAEKTTVKTVEKNGITFAFLGFTQEITAALSDSSKMYAISLDQKDKTQAEVYNEIKAMIKIAKENADIVVVSMSFENNEKSVPSEAQNNIVNYLISFGADIVIGSGTRTLQRAELISRDDGTKAAVAYSVGNLLSVMSAKENFLGGIADITVIKDGETQQASVEGIELIPVITYVGSGNTDVKVMPLSDFTQELSSTHGIYGFNLDFVNQYLADNIGNDIVETKVKPYDEVREAVLKAKEAEKAEQEALSTSDPFAGDTTADTTAQ